MQKIPAFGGDFLVGVGGFWGWRFLGLAGGVGELAGLVGVALAILTRVGGLMGWGGFGGGKVIFG